MQRLRPSTIYLLHQSSQALRSRLEHALRPLGITGLQYTILALLERRQGLSSADLSRRFFVTPQTMNQIVAGLTRRGLVTRRASAANRRILQMTLTDAGRELLAGCEEVCDRVEREAMASVPASDLMNIRENLVALLSQLRQASREHGLPVQPLAAAPAQSTKSRAPSAARTAAPASLTARDRASRVAGKLPAPAKKPVPSR